MGVAVGLPAEDAYEAKYEKVWPAQAVVRRLLFTPPGSTLTR